MAASFTGREQSTTPNREDAGSSSRGLGDIFLSHSGRQKPFVRLLYDALTKVNHTVFLDEHSLPVAAPFPDNIKRALRCCKVGVVVLSEDFLSSTWPMVELGLLFEHKKRVLPLFYMLSPDDLKCPTNRTRWQENWKDMVRSQEQESQWAAALKDLPIINGLVFNPGGGEAAYINKVVAKICEIHRPYDLHDQSSIQGRDALVKVIKGHFDNLVIEKVDHLEEACVVGLHGVGGQGKTTLCKSMVNFYTSEYFGRSCLIEFPTTRDMGMIERECQTAMRQLLGLRDEGSEVKKFDQVVAQMKKHVGAFDVFLAIDNIWDHSIEEARRLLGVGFTANSKVLLTSRSQKILSRLLSHTEKNKEYYHIDYLPAPDMEVAFQIFQQIVKQDDLTSSPFRYRIDSVLKRCCKKNYGKYHPLGVRALGAVAARFFGHGDSKRNADFWPRVLQKLEKAELKDVDDTIRLNYETLDEDQRHIFLDIAVWFSNPVFKLHGQYICAHVNQWLQFCYKFDEMDVSALIEDLAAAGVILIEKSRFYDKIIKVHDLYAELAQKEATKEEATKGPRFLTSTKEVVEGMEWGNLKRVILREREEKLRLCAFEKLQLHQCDKLEFLCVYGIKLEHFPESIASLRVLILQWPWHFDSKRTLLNLNGFVNLEYLSLENLPSLVKLEGQNGFPNLRMFFLQDCVHVEDLDLLKFSTQLEALVIDGRFNLFSNRGLDPSATQRGLAHWSSFLKTWPFGSFLKEIWKRLGPSVPSLWECEVSGCKALKRLPDLSPALKLLGVAGCTALKRLPDLGGLTALETLWLHNNTSLVEMGAFSPALKTVIITDCQALRLPDLGSVTGLEALILQYTGLTEVGCLSSALKFVEIDGCFALKKMPALGGLTGLETLALMNNASLEDVGSLSPALKRVEVQMCSALKRLQDLVGVTGLEHLKLKDNASLEEVGSLGCFGPALRELKVENCAALKTVPELDGLTGLKWLTLIGFSSLKEVGCLGPALEMLHAEGCGALKRTPDLGGVTGLERLTLKDNASLEEVGCLGPALTELRVENCAALKTVPELDGLTGLQRLTLINVSSLKEVGCLGPALRGLHFEGCGALKRTPDLGGATCLEWLTLKDNASLEEVGCLGPALIDLTVENCAALKTVPELDGLTCLKRLILINVSSLKEVGCFGPALWDMYVEGCGALKRIPDLGGVTVPGLKNRLTLKDNASLEEVGCLGPALRELRVENCAALKTVAELDDLTGLEVLTLINVPSLKEVGRLGPALAELYVEGCGALKRTPDLGGVTGLRDLTLRDNASLEEVGYLGPALRELEVENCAALKTVGCLGPALENLGVRLCGALQRMPDLSGLTGLKELQLVDNASLEEMGRLSPGLQGLAVVGCHALKRMPELAGLTCLTKLVLIDNASLEEMGRLSPALAQLEDRALKRMADFEGLTRLEVESELFKVQDHPWQLFIGLCPKLRTLS